MDQKGIKVKDGLNHILQRVEKGEIEITGLEINALTREIHNSSPRNPNYKHYERTGELIYTIMAKEI